MAINLPFFNDLDPNSLEEYYETDIDLGQETIQLDVNFIETSVAPGQLTKLKSFLDDLPGLIDIAKKSIILDHENGEDVKEFLTFHIEEFSQNDLNSLLKNADSSLPIDTQVLSVLKLRRIGFYPDNDEQFAVLDFILDEDLSQYILVVNMNSSKILDHITMES